MFRRGCAIPVALLLLCFLASAGAKNKAPLPADVLQARSVLVVIDPEAGVDVRDPDANRLAQENVEKALLTWGRFALVQEASDADLIITVRKGNGAIARPTIGGIPNNSRPGVLEPTQSGIRIGGRQGSSGAPGDPSDPQTPGTTAPHPQLEIGGGKDEFAVYRCRRQYDTRSEPLKTPPLWRYSARDALQAPDVPAVALFHQLVTETEKQQPPKKP